MSEKTSIEKSIEFIKKAGFSHIKVELEADLGRDGDRYCDNCDDGYVSCYECDDTGIIVTQDDNGNDIENECDDCYGEGRTECDSCGGDGYCGGYYSEESCDEFMREYIKSNHGQDMLDRLTYGEFYEDGSVDSEFTFTVPIEHAKDIVPWINSFKALADDIGGGIETGGAGMHISVIPDYSGGVYPVDRAMPVRNIRNFREEVAKLLPSLYFLASPDEVSRGLNYRNPQVSAREKYSAIYTHDDTTIEYRLFETTYNNPEDIFEQIEVIANTLKFYKDPTLKVETQGKIFGIGEQYGKQVVKRFYNTPEKIIILRKQLAYLKPEGKTVSQLFKEKGVLGITELRKDNSKRRGELRREWYRQSKLVQERMKEPMTEREQQRYAEYKEYQRRYDDYRDFNDEQLKQMSKGLSALQTLDKYINDKLQGSQSERFQIAV